MAITNNNLPAQDNKSKLPSIKFRIWAAEYDDIDWDAFTAPTTGSVATITMKTGKYFAYIDCQPNSVKPNAASVGEIAPQGQLTIAAAIEGITEDSLQWIYDNNGKQKVVIWENCATGKKFIAGSPCSGLRLSYEALGVIDDWQGANIKFTGSACPEPFWFFSGTIPVPAT